MPRTATKLPKLASVDTLAKLATQGSHARGWYDHAHAEIVAAARILGTTPKRFAEALAVTSPRVSVRRNIRMAIHYILTGEPTHDTMRGVRASLAHWEATGEIRGPKTSAFAAALLGDGSAIVLDVWMARAFKVDQNEFSKPRVYAEASRRIRLAAKRVGMTPAECQACIWMATVQRDGFSTDVRVFSIVDDVLEILASMNR